MKAFHEECMEDVDEALYAEYMKVVRSHECTLAGAQFVLMFPSTCPPLDGLVVHAHVMSTPVGKLCAVSVLIVACECCRVLCFPTQRHVDCGGMTYAHKESIKSSESESLLHPRTDVSSIHSAQLQYARAGISDEASLEANAQESSGQSQACFFWFRDRRIRG